MHKNPTKSKIKRFGVVKKTFIFVVVAVLLYLIGIGTLFIPAVLNLKENPCTHVPLLSDWGVIPKCSATQTCLSDNYCTWTLTVIEDRCNFSAINIYEERCNERELGKYTKDLGTEMAEKVGWNKEVDVCYDLTHVIKNYKSEFYWAGVNFCPEKLSSVDSYCKKTEFDILSGGLGQCAVRFK